MHHAITHTLLQIPTSRERGIFLHCCKQFHHLSWKTSATLQSFKTLFSNKTYHWFTAQPANGTSPSPLVELPRTWNNEQSRWVILLPAVLQLLCSSFPSYKHLQSPAAQQPLVPKTETCGWSRRSTFPTIAGFHHHFKGCRCSRARGKQQRHPQP